MKEPKKVILDYEEHEEMLKVLSDYQKTIYELSEAIENSTEQVIVGFDTQYSGWWENFKVASKENFNWSYYPSTSRITVRTTNEVIKEQGEALMMMKGLCQHLLSEWTILHNRVVDLESRPEPENEVTDKVASRTYWQKVKDAILGLG